MFNISSAATHLTVEDGRVLSEAYRYMSQIPLPDGMSVFGNFCPGSKSFDFEHMNSNGDGSCFDTALELSQLLRTSENPVENRAKRLKAIKESYNFLVTGLYRLTPSAISLFKEILSNSTVYQTPISVPTQPERAALYRQIANWRIFKDPKPDDALEAIRIERERLEAIAAEEAARIVAAEHARLEVARKAAETGVRRRYVPRTQNTGDDDRATVNDPLISRHPRFHY
jgi:hypothetical protein